jgi:hypothetical protein
MVLPPLALVRLARGNQPDDCAAQGKGDRKKPPVNLAAAVLAVQPVRVEKNPCRVLERYAVFGDILSGLPAVPFKS